MKRREEILEKVEAVSAMPPMAIEAISLLQDPEADMAVLVRTIEFDQGLTANILRLANSGLFGRPRSVTSVREAIVRLGTRKIFELLVSSAVFPVINRPVKGYGLAAGDLWMHAAAVAVGVEELAEGLGVAAPEHAFTAALLHDVGKIVLGTFVEVDASPVMSLAFQERLSFDMAERRILGIDHAEVGAFVLKQWLLPSCIVDVGRWHHEPENFPSPTLVNDLVHVADAICMQEGIGAGNDGLNYRSCREVVSRLGLSTRVVEEVACRTLTRLEEARNLLEAKAER